MKYYNTRNKVTETELINIILEDLKGSLNRMAISDAEYTTITIRKYIAGDFFEVTYKVDNYFFNNLKPHLEGIKSCQQM